MSFPKTSAFAQEIENIDRYAAQRARLVFQTPEKIRADQDARRAESAEVIDNTVGVEKHVLEEWVYALRGTAEITADARVSHLQGPAPADALERLADEIQGYLDR